MIIQFGLSSRFIGRLSNKLHHGAVSFTLCNRHRQLSTDKKPAPAKPNYLNVFDRQTKLLQRKRAAELVNAKEGKDKSIYDYIKDEVSACD